MILTAIKLFFSIYWQDINRLFGKLYLPMISYSFFLLEKKKEIITSL